MRNRSAILRRNDDPIAVLNPIASQMSVMRSTLLGGLVNALSYNVNRKAHRVRVFEIGRVYRRDPAQPDGPLQVAGVDQPNRVAGLAYGPNDDEQWAAPARDVDFFDVKGDIESLLPTRTVRGRAASRAASRPQRDRSRSTAGASESSGSFIRACSSSTSCRRRPIVFEIDLEPLLVRALPRHGELSRFQPVQRDISVTVADSVAGRRRWSTRSRAVAFRAPPVGAARVQRVRRLPCSRRIQAKSRKRVLTCC